MPDPESEALVPRKRGGGRPATRGTNWAAFWKAMVKPTTPTTDYLEDNAWKAALVMEEQIRTTDDDRLRGHLAVRWLQMTSAGKVRVEVSAGVREKEELLQVAKGLGHLSIEELERMAGSPETEALPERTGGAAHGDD